MHFSDRENIEWTNCWWSRANKSMNRILLIGDSVIRSVRGELEKCMLMNYAVDLFATSLDINDDLLWKHISLFLNTDEYKYECIIVQYGFHHGLNRRCVDSKSYRNTFKVQYRRLMGVLKTYCLHIVLVTGNSEVYADQVDILDEIKEKEIICRNLILKEISEEFGCSFFDMHHLMHEVKNDYKHIDAQHYEKGANLYIAYELYMFLVKRQCVCHDKILSVETECQQVYKQIFGSCKKIIIYGTGKKAKELFIFLKRYFREIESIQFVESCPEKEKMCLCQKVIRINSLPEEEKNNAVLVIGSVNHNEEMRKKAKELQFECILDYEYVWNGLNKLDKDWMQ